MRMMKSATISFLLSVSACLPIGCAKRVYVETPTDQRVFLVTQGDRLIRAQVKPSEIQLPWPGVVISRFEYKRLLDIEKNWRIRSVTQPDQP